MSSLGRLPPEILDVLFSLFDNSALSCCANLCRDFLPFARAHLYTHLNWDWRVTRQSFQKKLTLLLAHSSHLLQNTRTVKVWVSNTTNYDPKLRQMAYVMPDALDPAERRFLEALLFHGKISRLDLYLPFWDDTGLIRRLGAMPSLRWLGVDIDMQSRGNFIALLLIPSLRCVRFSPEFTSSVAYPITGPPHGTKSLPALEELGLKGHPSVTPAVLRNWMIWVDLSSIQRLVLDFLWDSPPPFPSNNRVQEIVLSIPSTRASYTWIPKIQKTFPHIQSFIFSNNYCGSIIEVAENYLPDDLPCPFSFHIHTGVDWSRSINHGTREKLKAMVGLLSLRKDSKLLELHFSTGWEEIVDEDWTFLTELSAAGNGNIRVFYAHEHTTLRYGHPLFGARRTRLP
ncbi:hypothetical protein DL96DRAFT_1810987 [Flagelloscypha sp. PMI_526]|nr:hypothetical protein DL96DRAFT_1810987 [Flagelloscypha sp. PMI_526]